MATTITVAIEKGGVGKTATVTNLAALMAMDGHRTLVVDMDPQCNSTFFATGFKKREAKFRGCGVAEMLRVYGQGIDYMKYVQPTNIENLFILPSNAATASIPSILSLLAEDYGDSQNRFLAYCLSEIEENFDFIVIDTPPNLDLLTTNALVASDYVIIPFNCEEQALDGLQNTEEMRARLVREEEGVAIDLLGILLTMVERTLLTAEMRQTLLDSRYGPAVFHSEIRKGQAVKDSASLASPVVVCGKSTNPAKDYAALYREILTRLAAKEG